MSYPCPSYNTNLATKSWYRYSITFAFSRQNPPGKMAGLVLELLAVVGLALLLHDLVLYLLPIAVDLVVADIPREWRRWKRHRTQQRSLNELQTRADALALRLHLVIELELLAQPPTHCSANTLEMFCFLLLQLQTRGRTGRQKRGDGERRS